MKLTALLLLASLVLSSCSTSRFGTNLKETVPIQDVDLSGTLFELGGMLINDVQVAHVTHWPIWIGQPVKLEGINGVWTHRTIIKKEDLEDDLSVLTLNEPVSLENHTIIPFYTPVFDIPTTVFVFPGRLTRGTTVRGYDRYGRIDLNLAKDHYLIAGDSGKVSVQRQGGALVAVTLNSLASGIGPDVHKILNKYGYRQ